MNLKPGELKVTGKISILLTAIMAFSACKEESKSTPLPDTPTQPVVDKPVPPKAIGGEKDDTAIRILDCRSKGEGWDWHFERGLCLYYPEIEVVEGEVEQTIFVGEKAETVVFADVNGETVSFELGLNSRCVDDIAKIDGNKLVIDSESVEISGSEYSWPKTCTFYVRGKTTFTTSEPIKVTVTRAVSIGPWSSVTV